jgi:hypothetical protein
MKAQEILDRIGSLDTDISLAAESFKREAAALLAGGQGRKLPHYSALHKYSKGGAVRLSNKADAICEVYPFVKKFREYYLAYLEKRAQLLDELKTEVGHPYPYHKLWGDGRVKLTARDQEKDVLRKEVARLKRELAQLKEKK